MIATASYADATLHQLRAPGQDASDLAAVLADGAIGGFEVEPLIDAPAETIRRHIARFCHEGEPRDLALIYLSCHGVLDERGRLYYAATDTERGELLSVTAIPAAWLNEQLDDCRSRRQILVLDCCHSGAFAKGAKSDQPSLALRSRFEARGRVVLTASRATEYSFEGDTIVGDGAASVFTDALVKGLRSGDADGDRDGIITVQELYDYAFHHVKAGSARQTPSLWTQGVEGSLVVAHSLKGAVVEPAALPEDLRMSLESPRPRVREVAVHELADLLAGEDAGLALSAERELERIAAQDIPVVAGAARSALETHRPSAPAPPPATPPPPEPEPEPPPPATPQRDEPGSREPAVARPTEPRRPAAAAPKRDWRKIVVAVAVPLILAGIVAAVVALGGDGGGGGGGGSSESSSTGSGGVVSGEWVRMRAHDGAQERGEAHLFRDSGPMMIGLRVSLTETERNYKILLFDDVGSVEDFSSLPDSAVAAPDTGPDGTLVTVDSGDDYRYTHVELPDNWRNYRYAGLARVSGGSGQLRVFVGMRALRDAAA